jgi:hypothetical protein
MIYGSSYSGLMNLRLWLNIAPFAEKRQKSRQRMKRFEHLNTKTKPLDDGIDLPAEKLPEPIRIDISKKQYDKFFYISDDAKEQIVNMSEHELDMCCARIASCMKETEAKIAASFQDSLIDAPSDDSSQSSQ